MVLLGRDKYAMTNDAAIVYDANNYNQGMVFGSIGYDHSFTDKLAGSLNAGFAAVAEDNANPYAYDAGSHDSDYLGTEVNAELSYKVLENLTLTVRLQNDCQIRVLNLVDMAGSAFILVKVLHAVHINLEVNNEKSNCIASRRNACFRCCRLQEEGGRRAQGCRRYRKDRFPRCSDR
jgi:hypothetical protein